MTTNHIAEADLDDEIDLRELFLVLWRAKLLIAVIVAVFASGSVFYAISLPNIYQSKALLAPKSSSGNLASNLQQYAGLASLAGVSLPGGEADETTLAYELLRSKSFFADHLYEEMVVELMASKSWDRVSKQLQLDSDIYDIETSTWVRDVSPPLVAKPHIDEAFQKFLESVSTSTDTKSNITTLSARHISPQVAHDWLGIIIEKLNESVKNRKVNEANASISYLKNQIKDSSLVKMDDIFASLIEEQTKTIMLASVSKNFLFSVLQRPDIPLHKAEPKRAMICIVGSLLGVLVAIIFALVRHYVLASLNNKVVAL